MGLKNGALHRSLFVSPVVTVMILMALFSSGCGDAGRGKPPGDSPGPERDIPLKTLAQGVSSEYGRSDEIPIPEDAPPECMVITDREQYQRLLSLSAFQEPLGEVDFETDVVIAAMQGPKNTGGYAISIMHASQAETRIRVEVDLVEPEPGSITVQALTSPYHLVTAERAGFDPHEKLIFTFVDQDDILIDQKSANLRPIPKSIVVMGINPGNPEAAANGPRGGACARTPD